MKLILKILLTILTIPVMLICVLSINIRFQLLNTGFWLNTFEKAGVYTQVSKSLNDKFIAKVEASGGKKSDVALLSSMISAGNLRAFVKDNLESILAYANGQTKEIIVSVPLSGGNLRNNLDINDLGSLSQKMKLSDFLNEYKVEGVTAADLAVISKFGTWAWMLTFTSFALLILILACEYFLTKPEGRLGAMGTPLVISGIIILIIDYLGKFAAETVSHGYSGSSNIGTMMIAIASPPLILRILQIWLWFGVSAFTMGILLFFIKKPANNKSGP